jgi:hypothetical protein
MGIEEFMERYELSYAKSKVDLSEEDVQFGLLTAL